MEKFAGSTWPNRILPLIYISFFLSGTAGLIYEIVWMRLLALSFGSMVFAVGAVLSSFMAGLALGNFVLGRASERWQRLLLVYAGLEAGIGLTALLVPGLLRLVGSVRLPQGHSVQALLTQTFLTFILSLVVLAIPAALMGGTLPVLSRALIRTRQEIGGKVGALYSLNTLGGAAGVALGGMILLPLMGMRNLTYTAAALNLSIALAVGAAGFRAKCPTSADLAVPDSIGAAPFSGSTLMLLVAAGLSGLAAMIYEVSWTRSLSLVIGSSVYAFSTMLLSFIFGIGLGSLLFARIFRRRSPSLPMFSLVEAAIAISCIFVVLTFDRLPSLFMKLYGVMAPRVSVLFVGELLVCFLVMLVPTVLLGAALPMVAHILATRMHGVGRSIGTVYGSNTLGCIVGSASASFLLIPLVGLETGLKVAIAVNIAASLLAFAVSRGRRLTKYAFFSLCIALVAVVFAAPKRWNKGVMSVGVAPNAVWLEKLTRIGDLETIASVPELLYYKDGLSATVAVKKDRRDISISIDGKTDASAVGDLPTELLVGYLPLFIHSDPETVMVLGLGSGISLAATLAFGVEYSECLEIEPAVVEASRFFSHVNREALSDPRAKVLLADGRHHLLSTANRYHVITSEPSNPWMAGISNLFTREFYEVCASRLKTGGVMCQFIHGYNLTSRDFRMVMATFSSVFPHKQLWSSAFGLDYLMIGSLDSMPLDLDRIGSRMEDEDVRADLRQIGILDATDLLAHFLIRDETWDEIAAGAPINTDNLPILEFSAPRSLYLTTGIMEGEVGRLIHEDTIREPPQIILTDRHRGRIHARRGELFSLHDYFPRAIREYDAAIELLGDWHVPYLKRARVYLSMTRRGSSLSITRAEQDLTTAIELDPDSPEVYVAMAELSQLQGKPDHAAQRLMRAVDLAPRIEYYEDLIDILIDDLGSYGEAERFADEALSVFGEESSLLEKKGFIAEVTGEYTTAAHYYQKATEADPYSSANYRLGRLLLALGQPSRALEYLEKAVRLGPTFTETHTALAKAYAAMDRRSKAVRSYRNALRVDPNNPEAQAGLNSLR
jgi:spermidine synthase